MAIYIVTKYTKDGATFASAEDAYADKNSLWGEELTQAVDSSYAAAMQANVLLEPPILDWYPDVYMLRVMLHVTSLEQFNSLLTFDIVQCINRAGEAGWTLIYGPTANDNPV